MLPALKGNRYTIKGGNSFKIVLPSLWKGVYSKREEFATMGSKFFPFRVDSFQNELGVQKSKQEVTKVASLVKLAESIPSVSVPLSFLIKG